MGKPFTGARAGQAVGGPVQSCTPGGQPLAFSAARQAGARISARQHFTSQQTVPPGGAHLCGKCPFRFGVYRPRGCASLPPVEFCDLGGGRQVRAIGAVWYLGVGGRPGMGAPCPPHATRCPQVIPYKMQCQHGHFTVASYYCREQIEGANIYFLMLFTVERTLNTRSTLLTRGAGF